MCPVSIFDIYKVTLKHQNAAFTDKIATFAWSKKTVVGGCYGRNASLSARFCRLQAYILPLRSVLSVRRMRALRHAASL